MFAAGIDVAFTRRFSFSENDRLASKELLIETENNDGHAPPPPLDIFALKFDTVNAIFTPVIHWLQLLLLLHLYNNCMTMCN